MGESRRRRMADPEGYGRSPFADFATPEDIAADPVLQANAAAGKRCAEESAAQGNICLECRRPFEHLEGTATGRREDGNWTLACEPCARTLVSIHAVGLSFQYLPVAARRLGMSAGYQVRDYSHG